MDQPRSRLAIGRVYVIGERFFLAVAIKSGDRLLSLRRGKEDLRRPGGEEKEYGEPLSVEDLCQCWEIHVNILDSWVMERCYVWLPEFQAGVRRGEGQGWTNCLNRGEARGRLFGMEFE